MTNLSTERTATPETIASESPLLRLFQRKLGEVGLCRQGVTEGPARLARLRGAPAVSGRGLVLCSLIVPSVPSLANGTYS